MNDLISRQAAIDAHYEYCNKHPDASFPVWSLKILEDLPSAQPERRWIPRKDRMPKKDGEYLVSDIYRNVYKSSYGYDVGNQYIWRRFVKAWMPLPESYKGGTEQ